MEENESLSCNSIGNYEQIKESMNEKSFTNSFTSKNYIKEEDEDEDKINEINKVIFICKKCHSRPKIIFNLDNSFDIKCNCTKIQNLWLRSKDFHNNYSFCAIEDVKKYFYCKEHKDNKYIGACPYCKDDICNECIETNIHKNHQLLNFNEDAHISDIINLLYRLIILTGQNSKIGNIDWDFRKNLIESVINSYKEFPCRNLYKSIKSAKNYLENLNKKEEFRRIITEEIELSFNKTNSNFIQTIIKIDISKQNFNDLSIFKELDLRNLKKLILKENYIKNIEPLYFCKFEQLEIFDLENNKLNYQSLKNFEKMQFSKIKFINLYINEIESIKIFEKILNFKTLTKFHIGANKFEKNEIINNINKKYDLNFIQNLGITGNFTDETIHFISNMILSDLETLYISRNNLSSLKILKDIKCPKLFKLWAIENNLKDFNDILNLSYKDKLSIINLKNNKIKNINNLIEFISNFPSLTELVLSNNEINLDVPNNRKIINNIKNKYINLQLNIENQKQNIQ